MAVSQVARGLTLMLLVFYQGCHSEDLQCGVAVNNNRIVGGEDAVPNSWPWQAALIVFGNFRCGGSLINSQWVLTAAHCLTANEANYTEVVLGLHNMSNPDANNVTRSVMEIICHSGYNDQTFDNDICLLKLAATVTFSDSVQPICLSRSNSTFNTGDSSWVTGFGVTLDSYLADVLQEVRVPIVGNNECGCAYSGEYDITDNMICAGATNMDACQGDSGGPLMTKMSTYWVQAGVVSFGIGCGLPGYPGVYTNVSAYNQWISDHVDQPVGFRTFTSTGIDTDSGFVCPTRPPTFTFDDSIFDGGESLIHSAHLFSVCAVGLSLHALVGGGAM